MTMKKKKAAALPDSVEHTHVPICIPDTDVHLQGYETPHLLAPKPGPYRFSKEVVSEIAAGLALGTNLMLTGPTGCGKTSVIKEIAAVLGRPYVRFNCHGETRVSNLVGMQRPAEKNGVLTLQFNLGDMAVAMKEGYWVLLDEIDAALPSVLFVLQPVLEEGNRTLHIPDTGETIHAHPDFAVFATGNTVGYRSMARARHAGTHSLNAAFLDRFGVVIDCDYPDRLEEIERIRCHVPDLDIASVDAACRVAAHLRSEDKFQSDFSTRRLVQWCKLMEVFGENIRAAELAVLRKLESPTDAEVARETIQRLFGFGE